MRSSSRRLSEGNLSKENDTRHQFGRRLGGPQRLPGQRSVTKILAFAGNRTPDFQSVAFHYLDSNH
jgi:hypothetical protein